MRQPFTRRSFLKRTLGAAGAAAAAFPAIVPSQALGAGGAVAPRHSIVMGGILSLIHISEHPRPY